MIGANRTVAKYWAELKIAAASPRSSLGNHAEVMRLLPGNDGASAAPTSRRRPNSAATARPPVRNPIPPWSTVNTDHRKMLKKYVTLEPKRSSSHPPGSWAITYDHAKAEKMYPISTGDSRSEERRVG